MCKRFIILEADARILRCETVKLLVNYCFCHNIWSLYIMSICKNEFIVFVLHRCFYLLSEIEDNHASSMRNPVCAKQGVL